MNEIILYTIVLSAIGFMAWIVLKPRQQATIIEQGNRPPTIIEDYERLGGAFKINRVDEINDDKAIFYFENGMALQYYWNEFLVKSKRQAIAGTGSPIWVVDPKNIVDKNENKGGEVLNELKKEKEKLKREKQYYEASSKNLESNTRIEVKNHIEDIIKLQKSLPTQEHKNG